MTDDSPRSAVFFQYVMSFSTGKSATTGTMSALFLIHFLPPNPSYYVFFLFHIPYFPFVLSPASASPPSVCCLRWPHGSALISFCPEHQSITSNPTCHLSPFPSLHCVTLSPQLVLHLSSHLSPHPPSLSLLSYFTIFYFPLTFILSVLERQRFSYPFSNFYF